MAKNSGKTVGKGNLKPFKPGQSGNLKGRPKKLPAIDALLADVLGEENGESTAKDIIKSMVIMAKRGDVRAAELILNRAYGKPKDNEGKPTEMIINVLRNS